MTGRRAMTLLLEIGAWPWLERLSRAERRVVTLADVPAPAWDELAARGFQAVYLMGVWRRSPFGRTIAREHEGLRREYDRVLPGWTPDDVPGSPFCIEGYEPDPRMGGWPALDAARAELRARGMSLFLDFVPNHTGFDHPWVAAYPERYVLGSIADVERAPSDYRPVTTPDGATVHVACGRDPYFPPWTDVAQLNFFNPETRRALVGELRAIAAHCDGVRCDMAMLPLNDVFRRTWGHVVERSWPAPADEFWPTATSEVPLSYLAEVYWDLEGTLLAQGFDFAYDKRLLDALHAPGAGARVNALLASADPPAHRLARFLENHDEARSADAFGGRVEAAAAVVATLPGMGLFFDGQLEGARARAPVQLGRWPDEPPDARLASVYRRILAFAASDVVRAGEWKLLRVAAAGDGTFADLVAYRWRAAAERALVVANLGTAPARGFVAIGDDFNHAPAVALHDALSGETYHRTRESLERDGLFVRLDGGRAHLLRLVDGH